MNNPYSPPESDIVGEKPVQKLRRSQIVCCYVVLACCMFQLWDLLDGLVRGRESIFSDLLSDGSPYLLGLLIAHVSVMLAGMVLLVFHRRHAVVFLGTAFWLIVACCVLGWRNFPTSALFFSLLTFVAGSSWRDAGILR